MLAEGETARAVERVFWLTPGHASQPGRWYAGSSPAGLFVSADNGVTWQPVAGFNDRPMRAKWVLGGTDRLATRYLVNDASVLLGKPLVSAAIHRFEGQAMTHLPGRGPCDCESYCHKAIARAAWQLSLAMRSPRTSKVDCLSGQRKVNPVFRVAPI